MLTRDQVDDTVNCMVSALGHPARIILFGSYGRGEATEDSDIDLFVVETDRHKVERDWEALSVLGPEHFRVLTLAGLFRDQGRNDEALRWVEPRITAFPNERNDDLLGLAIELQQALGRHAGVERLAWQRFEQAPGCGAFFKLMEVAVHIDHEAALRKRAFECLWRKVAEDEALDSCVRRSPWDKPRRGEIVSILLREGAAEAMWDVFSGGKVDVGLWEPVADACGAWTTRL